VIKMMFFGMLKVGATVSSGRARLKCLAVESSGLDGRSSDSEEIMLHACCFESANGPDE